jgi:hypothetical protein
MKPADVLNEFYRLLDSDYEISDENVRQGLIQTVHNMVDDSHWRSLDEAGLTNLLYEGITIYGQTNWEPLVAVIAPIYLYAMEHVRVETRRDLQVAIRERIENNGTSISALLPLLFLETDLSIVSTSVVDFAMCPKALEDDPIGWPRRLVSDFETAGPTNKGAVLGGLVTLGDKRINELLREVKWLASDDEVGVAVKCVSGMPSVAAVEFWLEWAEELVDAGLDNSRLFGQVACGLPFLFKNMQVDVFSDVSRNFGYLHQDGGNKDSMVVHGQYSKAEIAERYADRLYALEAAEPPPKLTSDVIREFGMEPKAPSDDQFSAQ